MQNWKHSLWFLPFLLFLFAQSPIAYSRGGGGGRIAAPAVRSGVAGVVSRPVVQANAAAQSTTTTQTNATTTSTTTTTKTTVTTSNDPIRNFFATTTFRNVLTGAVGTSVTNDAGVQTSFAIAGTNYAFRPFRDTRQQGVYGLFFGREFDLNPKTILQLGLAYYQAAYYLARGNQLQGPVGTPGAAYLYSYSLTSRRAVIEGKVLANTFKGFHPYLNLGFGAAFNSGFDYEINSPTFVFSPVFAANNTTSFTYHVGLGFDYDLQKDIRVGAIYRFADIGYSAMGQGSLAGALIPYKLTQNHLLINEFMAELSYIF